MPATLPRLLFLVCASLALAAGVEWEQIRQLIQWKSLAPTTVDRIALFWIIWSKTICLLAPAFVAAFILDRRHRPRAASATWLIGSGGVLLWLGLDLQIQEVTGNHLVDYAAFLADVSTWQWAGGGGGLMWPLATVVVSVVAACIGIHWLAGYATRRLARYGESLVRHATRSLAVTTAVVGLGVIPIHYFLGSRPAVQQLNAVLVCNPLGGLVVDAQNGALGEFRTQVDEQSAKLFHDLLEQVRTVPPVDTRDCQLPGPPKNVIVILLESLRYDVFEQKMMPRLAAWSQKGLRLERHYAGSNASHLGVFALLYSRSPLFYQVALDAKLPPQACETFHRAGYQCSYVGSSTITWMRMEEYLRVPFFDTFELHKARDWPTDDVTVLHRVRELATGDRPQFIVAFLNSSHLPYVYPPEFEKHQPVVPEDQVVASARGKRAEIMNRYRNAAGFLDEQLAELLANLDPQRNIVVVTGDHGESLFDDGSLSHWGRLSEIQTRTPMVIVGDGVPTAEITTATTHADVLPTVLHALAGKPVPLAHTHGRDLLDGPQPDQVLICTMAKSRALAGSQVWDALLVRRQERLHLKLGLKPPQMHVLGFFDESGRFDSQPRGAQDDPAVWSTALRSEWQKLAR